MARFALPDVVLAPGEVVALTGPTRSGKTTFVNLLAGWDRPDTGTIVWEGAPPGLPPWSMLAVVPQQFALVDELDVIDNITLAARGGTPMTDADVAQLLDALRLDRLRNRNVQEISVGERQRVMVARALAGAAGGRAGRRAGRGPGPAERRHDPRAPVRPGRARVGLPDRDARSGCRGVGRPHDRARTGRLAPVVRDVI